MFVKVSTKKRCFVNWWFLVCELIHKKPSFQLRTWYAETFSLGFHNFHCTSLFSTSFQISFNIILTIFYSLWTFKKVHNPMLTDCVYWKIKQKMVESVDNNQQSRNDHETFWLQKLLYNTKLNLWKLKMFDRNITFCVFKSVQCRLRIFLRHIVQQITNAKMNIFAYRSIKPTSFWTFW